MRLAEGTYLFAASFVGAVARSIARGLPEGVRLRLMARPPEDLRSGWLWVHAVSVGELLLAQGLLGWLREEGYRIHVTTGTLAGWELLNQRLPEWDAGTGQVTGGPFPLDDPEGLAPFWVARPGAFLALETELWPNLLRQLAECRIPSIVVNGRLTPRTLARGGPWMRQAARRLTVVAARDEAAVEAFRALGAPRVVLGGNLKADLPPPRPLRDVWAHLRRAWAEAPIVVAGNTIVGEEELVLDAWEQARTSVPSLRLILAPRQPKRFSEVAEMLRERGRSFRRASEPWPEDSDAWAACDILLLDTLGELPSAYGEGTVALVGGGWKGTGGHNPLEPARFGMPTLIGPGHDNFVDVVEPLVAAERVRVVPGESLGATLITTLAEAPLRPGELVPLPEALRGALGRTCSILKDVLPPPR